MVRGVRHEPVAPARRSGWRCRPLPARHGADDRRPQAGRRAGAGADTCQVHPDPPARPGHRRTGDDRRAVVERGDGGRHRLRQCRPAHPQPGPVGAVRRQRRDDDDRLAGRPGRHEVQHRHLRAAADRPWHAAAPDRRGHPARRTGFGTGWLRRALPWHRHAQGHLLRRRRRFPAAALGRGDRHRRHGSCRHPDDRADAGLGGLAGDCLLGGAERPGEHRGGCCRGHRRQRRHHGNGAARRHWRHVECQARGGSAYFVQRADRYRRLAVAALAARPARFRARTARAGFGACRQAGVVPHRLQHPRRVPHLAACRLAHRISARALQECRGRPGKTALPRQDGAGRARPGARCPGPRSPPSRQAVAGDGACRDGRIAAAGAWADAQPASGGPAQCEHCRFHRPAHPLQHGSRQRPAPA